MESKEWKPDSLINVEKMSKHQFDNEKEENPNFKYLDWLTSPLSKLGAEQLNKLQSYIVIQDILDQLTWISSAKLDEEAGDFFAGGIPQTTMNEMVLLGLANQNQDQFGQISYQPSRLKQRRNKGRQYIKKYGQTICNTNTPMQDQRVNFMCHLIQRHSKNNWLKKLEPITWLVNI